MSRRARPVCLALWFSTVAWHGVALPGSRAPTGEPVRGITLSTHTDGGDWASPLIGETLEEIREVGAGWVAIHPYAGIRSDGQVRFRSLDPGSPPEYLTRPIREAHARGLKILIKPHLAYWGSPFRWRGDIAFEGEEQWRRFWQGYEGWIVNLAAATADADGFVVGTELDRTLGFEDRWRRIISSARQVTGVPLTYAANWTHFEDVPFWDALDVIGIQAYFPLAETPDPGDAAIRKSWQQLMERLRTVALRENRAIVFTELGYNRSFAAPIQPWDARTDDADAERVQQACMRAALEAIEGESTVLGAFLWKWFPKPYSVGRNFQLDTPAMKRVIRGVWTRPARSRGH